MCTMRGFIQVAVSAVPGRRCGRKSRGGTPFPPLLSILALLTASSGFASEGTQESRAQEAAKPRPTLEGGRGHAGLFGGFSTAGADGLESGTLFGASGAFFFTKRLGIEAGVHRRSLDVLPTSSNQLSGGSLDSTAITGGLVFRFPISRRMVPYVAAGVAYFSNKFEVSAAVSGELADLNFRLTEEVKSGLGFNVGAGVGFRVLDRFALFGEARYLAGPADTRAELADTMSGVAAEVAGQQDLNGLEIRAGIRFVFGARPKEGG